MRSAHPPDRIKWPSQMEGRMWLHSIAAPAPHQFERLPVELAKSAGKSGAGEHDRLSRRDASGRSKSREDSVRPQMMPGHMAAERNRGYTQKIHLRFHAGKLHRTGDSQARRQTAVRQKGMEMERGQAGEQRRNHKHSSVFNSRRLPAGEKAPEKFAHAPWWSRGTVGESAEAPRAGVRIAANGAGRRGWLSESCCSNQSKTDSPAFHSFHAFRIVVKYQYYLGLVETLRILFVICRA
jgi:hypothetical protein